MRMRKTSFLFSPNVLLSGGEAPHWDPFNALNHSI